MHIREISPRVPQTITEPPYYNLEHIFRERLHSYTTEQPWLPANGSSTAEFVVGAGEDDYDPLEH